MLIYDKQIKNLSDFTKYDHISIRVLHLISKLMSAIFEEQAEGDGETSGDVVSLYSPECALYRTSRLTTVPSVSEKYTKIYCALQRTQGLRRLRTVY